MFYRVQSKYQPKLGTTPRMGALVAVINRNRENSFRTAVAMLDTLTPRQPETTGIASALEIRIERDSEKLKTRSMTSHIMIGHIFSRITRSDKPQPVKLKNATLVFEGRIYQPAKRPYDVQSITRKLQEDHEKTARALVEEVEGDFAFAIAEPERLVIGRDPVGTRPMCYGENENWIALASERKALWKIGIEKTRSFPPGYVAIVDGEGFKFKPVRTIERTEPRHISMKEAARQLQAILQYSIEKRLNGLKEVAVAFSGGLDSSLIAFLARDSKTDLHLIHASLENQKETEHAQETAEKLNLPLHVQLFNEDDVEKVIPEIVWHVEEPDPVKVSIGIPLNWAAKKTAELEIKVMLAGQGADELFGGYKRYVDEYISKDSEKARKRMFKDIVAIHETNLERDFKICSSHNVELRLPFAAYEMAEFATNLPLQLKIEPKADTLRKLVLRRAAKNLGMPQSVVKRPKKALQYATGVNGCLRKIANKNGLPAKKYLQQVFESARRKLMEHE